MRWENELRKKSTQGTEFAEQSPLPGRAGNAGGSVRHRRRGAPMTTATRAQEVTYVDAISQALDEEMSRDERVFLMAKTSAPTAGV
jgi:hypothetical protein